jgi:polysaccharide export outer membrane protein
MKTQFLICLVFIILAAQLVRAQAPAGTESQQGYMIGPGDEITTKVLGESQFDFVATVDQDGKIGVPFFDQPIIARCRTEQELKADVAKLLSKYLKAPQISLRVTQRNSRPPVSITGEVREQKQITLTRRAYLLELVSFVGGETEKSGGMIQVFRTRPPMCGEGTASDNWTVDAKSGAGIGVPSKIFSLASLRQGTAEANPEIFPGDIIVLPKASPIFVLGEVRKPGEISMPEGGLALTQAIALANGITREAKTKNVKVYRKQPGATTPDVIAVNYDEIKKGAAKDIMLRPFDIVEVDKAPKSFQDYLIEIVTGIPNRIPITY